MAAPILVTALFGDGDNGWLQELRRAHYPAALNRVPAHLTLFRQLPPSAESEIHRRLAGYASAAPPQARIAGVMDLGEGTALRVDSEDLEDIRYDLLVALHGLLTPQDSGGWTPHVTIQNKVDPKEARLLQQQLRGRYEGQALTLSGLATWRYLGGPWEPAKRFAFRG